MAESTFIIPAFQHFYIAYTFFSNFRAYYFLQFCTLLIKMDVCEGSGGRFIQCIFSGMLVQHAFSPKNQFIFFWALPSKCGLKTNSKPGIHPSICPSILLTTYIPHIILFPGPLPATDKSLLGRNKEIRLVAATEATFAEIKNWGSATRKSGFVRRIKDLFLKDGAEIYVV